MTRVNRRVLSLLAGLALLLAACGDSGASDTTAAPATTEATGTTTAAEMVPVRLQLQWFAQSQFAGYYAAKAEGYYADEGLDVSILEGGVDIVPQTVVATGAAEFGLAWVPKALVSNEQGAGIVNIGQVFQRSPTLQISFKSKGIESVEDFAGKRIGTWGFGNEFEILAALNQAGLDPDTDVTIVQQGFDMLQMLPAAAGGTGEIDAAQAMVYNEYAQVLETVNPDTGELYTPDDLNVINYNDVGTAMLQDGIWVSRDWLAQEGNEDVSVKFLRASFRGWIFCRDNPTECVDIVLAAGPTLGKSHMTWQLNEISALIWPSPLGIGVMDQTLWDQTIEVAVSQKILTAAPAADSFRSDLAEKAISDIAEETAGAGWTRTTVELLEGGK